MQSRDIILASVLHIGETVDRMSLCLCVVQRNYVHLINACTHVCHACTNVSRQTMTQHSMLHNSYKTCKSDNPNLPGQIFVKKDLFEFPWNYLYNDINSTVFTLLKLIDKDKESHTEPAYVFSYASILLRCTTLSTWKSKAIRQRCLSL